MTRGEMREAETIAEQVTGITVQVVALHKSLCTLSTDVQTLRAYQALLRDIKQQRDELIQACEYTLDYFKQQGLTYDKEPRFLDRIHKVLARVRGEEGERVND